MSLGIQGDMALKWTSIKMDLFSWRWKDKTLMATEESHWAFEYTAVDLNVWRKESLKQS